MDIPIEAFLISLAMRRFERWKQPNPPQETAIHLAKVESREIGYINSIVESYEGIGIIRTRDAHLGLLECWIVPDFREEFLTMIDALRREVGWTWVPTPDDFELIGVVDGVGFPVAPPDSPTDSTLNEE